MISGPSPTKSWATILRAVNEARKKPDARNSVSGPEYFGFAAQAVQELFQKLPNAEKCTSYYVFANGKRKMEGEDEASKRQRLDEHGNALTYEAIQLKEYTIEEVVEEADALERRLESDRQSNRASGVKSAPKPKLTEEEKKKRAEERKVKEEQMKLSSQLNSSDSEPEASPHTSIAEVEDDGEAEKEMNHLQGLITAARNQMNELQNRIREWSSRVDTLKNLESKKKK